LVGGSGCRQSLQIVSLDTSVFGLKMGVVLCGGISGTFIFGLKSRVGVLKKSKKQKKRRKNEQKVQKKKKMTKS